jgi:hypothetical protein
MHPEFISRRLIALVFALSLVVSGGSCSAVGDFVGQARGLIPESTQRAERSPRPTGEITIGPISVVGSGIVEPSGGIVRVQDPAGPLEGLELTVPAGAYLKAHQVNISYAPVLGHTFGEHFNPATPLITIENGAQHADELMTLHIPVEVPADHFAMAFYYDAAAGTLEGIPLAGIGKDSVDIVTRHFSSLVVSIIRNSVLEDLLKGGIDSGFRPGADDWQFTNRGSYIVPSGHCAGQSVSAMWYYCEKPDGNDPFLWNLYDNNGNDPSTPDLWQDDSYGYRLASTVQLDIRWGKFEVDFQRALRGQDDEAHFKAFAYAIMLTGEPQYVGISSSAGGGHAMIAYRVDSKGISIADPNYPGDTGRRIDYKDGAFTPYNSGANADEIAAGHGRAYESIGYMAKTALIDWSLLSNRWEELKDGTIGNDRFPAYDIRTVDPDGNEVPLGDGYESEVDRIKIIVQSTSTAIGTRVFRDGTRVPVGADGMYQLTEGNNVFGIDVWGNVSTGSHDAQWEYVDFKYVNVWYGPKDDAPGCRGWVLESVTPEWELKEREWGDQYETDYAFLATDGSFTGSGRKWIGEDVWQPPFNAWVRFAHEGTWTPLPQCIPAGQKGSVTFNISSPPLAVEGTPKLSYWGATHCYLSLLAHDGDDSRNLGQINSLSDTAEGASDSLTIELDLDAAMYGTPHDGDTLGLAVWFGCLTGEGRYLYTYVYHE